MRRSRVQCGDPKIGDGNNHTTSGHKTETAFSHHNVIDKQAPVLPDTRVMAVLLCYLRYQKVLLMFIEATVPGHCYCVHATDNDSILVPSCARRNNVADPQYTRPYGISLPRFSVFFRGAFKKKVRYPMESRKMITGLVAITVFKQVSSSALRTMLSRS